MKFNKSIIYKIFTLAVLIAVTTFYACDEKAEVSPKSELEFVEVTIPNAYKSTVNDRSSSDEVDDVIVDVQFTTNDGKEIVGKVHLVMSDDETLSYFAMTENLLSETNLTADFWISGTDATNGRRGIGTCLKNCKGMEKGEGKGWCKAGCWIELAAKVAGVIAAII